MPKMPAKAGIHLLKSLGVQLEMGPGVRRGERRGGCTQFEASFQRSGLLRQTSPEGLSFRGKMSHKPPLLVGYRVLTRLDDIPAVAWSCRYSPENPANSGV